MAQLIFATGNAGKMREIREILSDLPLEVKSMKEAGIIHETVEDGTTFMENALKKAAESTLPLAETLTSARYTTSRIRRIALQNLLTIHETVIRSALQSELYLRILAVKKDNEEILRALGASHFPTIARAHDENKLSSIGKKCYNT